MEFETLDTFHPFLKIFNNILQGFFVLELKIGYSCNFGAEFSQLRIALRFDKPMIVTDVLSLLLFHTESNSTQLNNFLARFHVVIFIACGLDMKANQKLDGL